MTQTNAVNPNLMALILKAQAFAKSLLAEAKAAGIPWSPNEYGDSFLSLTEHGERGGKYLPVDESIGFVFAFRKRAPKPEMTVAEAQAIVANPGRRTFAKVQEAQAIVAKASQK